MADCRTAQMITVLIAGSLMIAGCSTPTALSKLTKETGDNAIALSVALSNLEKKSKETATVRIAAAARLDSVISRIESRRRSERDLIKIYEDADAVAAYADIITLSDAEAAKTATAAQSSEIARKIFTGKLKPLDSDADDLRKLGVELLKFSKEDGKFDRAKFFIDFVKGVIKDLEKSDKSGDRAKDKAKAAVKKTEKNAPK